MNKYGYFLLTIFLLVREISPYDGDLDPTFGKNGTVITNFNSKGQSASSVAALSDDSLLVTGTIGNTTNSFILARYQVNGTLDTSFNAQGNPGWVTITFAAPYNSSMAQSMALQKGSNGEAQKIILAGTASISDLSYSFAVARLNLDGTPDSSFNPLGKIPGTIVTNFKGDKENENTKAFALAIQKNKKIVVVGSAFAPSFETLSYAIARYNPDGSLDQSFNSGGPLPGTLIANFGKKSIKALGVAVQSDNKIVVIGSTYPYFILTRFLPNGQLDAAFGPKKSGIVIEAFSPVGGPLNDYSMPHDIILQGSKILVAGYAARTEGFDYPTQVNSFAIARFNSDGSEDQSFNGPDGSVVTDFAAGESEARSLALQPDGKIIATGSFINNNVYGINTSSFALARYYSNGTLDSSFNPDGSPQGTVITNFGDKQSSASCYDGILQEDGKIVLLGDTNALGTIMFALARYQGTNSSENSAPQIAALGLQE